MREQIAAAVGQLVLDEALPTAKAPHLHIRRLRFTGDKHLKGQEGTTPFLYDQSFEAGVNVLLIGRNEAGKTSVLKTIKFALTGDRDSYDIDVKQWIKRVWLSFSLGANTYTVILATDDAVHGLLVTGEDFRDIDEVAASAAWLFQAKDEKTLKEELQHFFFERLGLTPLAWTLATSTDPGTAERAWTTWSTYFQALMPEPSNEHLICDAEHAMGNQQGLILSMFLGLSLAPALNQLTTEASLAVRGVRTAKQVAEEEEKQAEVRVKALEDELLRVRIAVREIQTAQHTRREAVEQSEPVHRLQDARGRLVQMGAEKARLAQQWQEFTTRIQQAHARASSLYERAKIQLQFTTIDVRLCPNCDSSVTKEALERESTEHECRLCGHQARPSSAEDIAALETEARDAERRAAADQTAREHLSVRLRELRQDEPLLQGEIERLEKTLEFGVTYALPTEVEQERLEHLQQEVGRLQAEIKIARPPSEARQDEIEQLDVRRRIASKLREVLRREADARNEATLMRLTELTQDTADLIGAVSLGDVRCSAVGYVTLRKNDQELTFGGIKNDGERLRFKLALFLAMIRLGREPGTGRHPGLLLVDQPGTYEMVQENAEALATIFRRIEEMGQELQILLFTSRPEFAVATLDKKVYGPQSPPYAF